jgi:carbonic anhydrase
MLKRGLDQITAWVLAVFCAGALGTGVFLLTKWSAGHHSADDGEEIADLGPDHAAPTQPADHDTPPASPKPAEASGKGPAWEYKGSSGPDHWGELADAYRSCKTGKLQSPVDIDEPVTNAKLLPIKFHYKEGDVVWKNNGRSVLGEVPSGSFVEIEGDRYDLVQFHFHAPSEHKVASAPYDMEMHLIHKSVEGKFLEVSVLFEEGKANKGLAELWKNLPELNETHPEPIAFNPAGILPAKRTYFHYMGSMTVPPCTEGRPWYVLTTPVEVSGKQVDELVRVVSFNARPVQPLNGRRVVKSTR